MLRTPVLLEILPLASFSDSMQVVWRFLASGGIFMGCIVVCSFVAVSAIISKFLEMRDTSIMPATTVKLLTDIATGASVEEREVRAVLIDEKSPLGRIARTSLLNAHPSGERAMEAAQAVAREEMVELERGVPLLEAIITAAPLLGLLGAVVGLTKVFSSVGADESDTARVAAGIAEALNTTIAGLIVAIPCVFFHTHFSRRLERVAARLEVLVRGAIDAAYHETISR